MVDNGLVAGTVNASAPFFRLAGGLSGTSTGLEAFTFSPTFCEGRRGLYIELWVKGPSHDFVGQSVSIVSDPITPFRLCLEGADGSVLVSLQGQTLDSKSADLGS